MYTEHAFLIKVSRIPSIIVLFNVYLLSFYIFTRNLVCVCPFLRCSTVFADTMGPKTTFQRHRVWFRLQPWRKKKQPTHSEPPLTFSPSKCCPLATAWHSPFCWVGFVSPSSHPSSTFTKSAKTMDLRLVPWNGSSRGERSSNRRSKSPRSWSTKTSSTTTDPARSRNPFWTWWRKKLKL